MTKLIEIDTCHECPSRITGKMKCGKTLQEISWRDEHYPIPEWCPLLDTPELSKKED